MTSSACGDGCSGSPTGCWGGATLGLGIVLAVAVVRFDRFLAAVALLAYLAYAAPHLVFHLGHPDGDEPGLSIALTVVMALSVLVPASALTAVRRVT